MDVTAFDAAIADGSLPALEQAITWYRGSLLEGCEEEWAVSERALREQHYFTALETLANAALARQQPARPCRICACSSPPIRFAKRRTAF